MKRVFLLMVIGVFVWALAGCTPRMLDSDKHSTRQVTPRDGAMLSCAQLEQQKKDCMRSMEYEVKHPEPEAETLDRYGCPPDADADGVPDFDDQCPGTPEGVTVETTGCPVDADGDGVPDYLDDCPDTPEDVMVDTAGCPLDTDADGVPDFQDGCPGTPQGLDVDDMGCPLDSDGDNIADYLDECPNTPTGAMVDKYGCWNSNVPLFEFDKAEILSEYTSRLDQVTQVMSNNPEVRIQIQGHADVIGPYEYNMDLSERRAEAVRDYLVDRGISRNRMQIKGLGYTEPRAPSDTEEGRMLNRRVEFRPL